MLEFDVVVIGGGGAGLRAAIEASKNTELSVALVSKCMPLRSTTGCTGGGMNAMLNVRGDDSLERYYQDTMAGSAYLADSEAVKIYVENSARNIHELEACKNFFLRDKTGTLTQHRAPGGSAARICSTLPHSLAHSLHDRLNRCNVQQFINTHLLKIVVEQERLAGIIVYDAIQGQILPIACKSIVIATGGYGQVYWANTTTPFGCTGDGISLCMQVGIGFKDAEMVQFNPTGVAGSGTLLSDAARGAGAYLLNNKGERFMSVYDPEAMEKSTRDKTALAIEQEIKAGRGVVGVNGEVGVVLDMRHLDRAAFGGRLDSVYDKAQDFLGVDLSNETMLVRPAAHFSMGGIEIADYTNGATSVPGIYAAGEAACMSVHGANRLGGNALGEVLTFGRLAGAAAAEYAKVNGRMDASLREYAQAWREKFTYLTRKKSEFKLADIRNRLGVIMCDYLGIIRDADSIALAQGEIAQLQSSYRSLGLSDSDLTLNNEFVQYTETGNMLEIAQAIAIAADARKESRGSHYRTDHPISKDAYLTHTIVNRQDGQLHVKLCPLEV